MHHQATKLDPEHDELVTSGGIFHFYPNRTSPHEIVFAPKGGGIVGLTCLSKDCSQMVAESHGNPNYPQGSYQIFKTEDPKVLVIRNSTGDQTIGYGALNAADEWKVFPDLQEANAYVHEGETAREVANTAGQVLLITLLIAIVSAGLFVGAASSVHGP